jgi:murein L,D-transpeptidase YcbB/YkuD
MQGLPKVCASKAVLVAALVVVGAVAGCQSGDLDARVATAIGQMAGGAPPAGVSDAIWADVRAVYQARSDAPLWIERGKADRVAAALRVIRQAAEHGFAPREYAEAEVARVVAAKRPLEDVLTKDPAAIARFDVRVTGALLALGGDVAIGRGRPESLSPEWTKRRTRPDLATSLAAHAADGRLDTWLDAVRPPHPEYAALQQVLAGMRHEGATGAADPRAQQIAVNLERWRWMPDDFGSRHILVNVPAFYMAVREQGMPVLEMKVVVGKTDHKTPIFSEEMSTIVFSPYWNVPDSIAEGETAPAAARDPGFLTRNGIEILRVSKSGTSIVDPRSVKWDDPDAIKALAFRQKPGPGNALGHVKFLFPNKYDVYLHDTPADALFSREGRALSHGCVRLEQPDALAKYVLRDRPEWDDERIDTAMHAGEEKQLPLKEKIPVHIVYFTAWPDGQGGVQLFPDVYGYDALQGVRAQAPDAAHELH